MPNSNRMFIVKTVLLTSWTGVIKEWTGFNIDDNVFFLFWL